MTSKYVSYQAFFQTGKQRLKIGFVIGTRKQAVIEEWCHDPGQVGPLKMNQYNKVLYVKSYNYLGFDKAFAELAVNYFTFAWYACYEWSAKK